MRRLDEPPPGVNERPPGTDGRPPGIGKQPSGLDSVGDPDRDAGANFDEVYHAHFRSLTAQLTAYCGDLTQAQDLVQEAFCRAYVRWSRVRRYDDPVAWIRRVAWNLATSRWRRLRTAQAFLRRQREEHQAGPTPDRVALTAALAQLPPNQRRATVLHYLADLPVPEVARLEGVPEGTVKSWLHRARAALAAQLSDTRGGDA